VMALNKIYRNKINKKKNHTQSVHQVAGVLTTMLGVTVPSGAQIRVLLLCADTKKNFVKLSEGYALGSYPYYKLDQQKLTEVKIDYTFK